MQMFFKEEINIYHQMFSRESQKSNSGLNVLNDFVRKIHECALNSTNAHEIQRSIRLLSIFAEILQTFNGSVETLVSSVDEQIFNEAAANSPNAECLLRVKDWHADLRSYRVGNTFTGIVSYILNAESKLCYVKDMTKHANVDFKGYLESVFEGTPVYGQIFAVEINQKFMRAVRVDSEPTNMAMRVRLIDIGETVPVSPNVYKYNLIEQAKRLPPMAILCRIEKLNGKMLNLLDPLYKKTYIVKIIDICVNMLEVELNTVIEQEDEEMNESILECIGIADQNGLHAPLSEPITPTTPNSVRSGAATPNSNPFLNYFPEVNNHQTQMPVMTNGYNGNGNHSENAFTKKESVVPSSKSPTRHPLPPVPPRQRPGHHSFKQKANETKITSIAPFNTSDLKYQTPIKIPIQLVRRRSNAGASENGNHTNNHTNHIVEKSPEKDSEPKTKQVVPKENNEPKLNGNGTSHQHETENNHDPCACQSGAHPKQPSIPCENGFIKMQPAREVLPTPLKGDEISVTPTHIINGDHFYVQYIDWYRNFEDFQFTILQKVELKQLSYIPKLGDTVLARYSDMYVYRARVEMIDQQHVTVLYVDYGNTETINIDALFEWDPVCDTIPFQAVLCRLANINCLPAISEQTIYAYMHSNYLNKMCKAIVVDNTENALQVRLISSYGRDIVEEINSHFHPECIV